MLKCQELMYGICRKEIEITNSANKNCETAEGQQLTVSEGIKSAINY